jgi:hypothetical protein
MVTLRRIVGSLLPLGSGGELTLETSSSIKAERLAQRAARDLADLQVVNKLDSDPTDSTESDDLTRAQLTAGLLRQLMQSDPYAALAALQISGVDALGRRRLLADLLR